MAPGKRKPTRKVAVPVAKKRATRSIARPRKKKRAIARASRSGVAKASNTTPVRVLAFHTVGIGASAGGLEALEAFFDATPADSGLAFVVVTHQHAGHVSLLPELLARRAKVPVLLVHDGMQVQPNHVYIGPPGKNLAILGGNLQTMEPSRGAEAHLPIDYFFRSLASDQGVLAACVVLSGTGTDGTLGLRAIKGQGGIAIVQDEHSATYSGMPLSAAMTGLADYVLTPDRMPSQLVRRARVARDGDTFQNADAELPDTLRKIFLLIRSHTGHDFSGYKMNTMRRRVDRRMRVHQLAQPLDYVRFLQSNPHELGLLFQELLIGVTSFFRDPAAFDALGGRLKKLIAAKPDGTLLRIWVPGCSTGEEAYSIAILAAEIIAKFKKRIDVQIFATDIDAEAIGHARAGVYAEGIAVDLGPARLEQFFARDANRYRINKEIRGMVVFAVQNAVKDPPFTKLDLVSFRNVLIYLNSELQKRLLPVFHYSLNPGGLLLLGTSETTGGHDRLFEPVDRKWRLYERKPSVRGIAPIAFPISISHGPLPAVISQALEPTARGVTEPAARLLLEHFAPPTVIVNERGDIVHVHGKTAPYLELNPGVPRSNLFAMAREGLRAALRSAIRGATRAGREVEHPNVQFLSGAGKKLLVSLTVQRLANPEAMRGLLRVSFELPDRPLRSAAGGPRGPVARAKKASDAERELEQTRHTLRGTVEELETSNEELKSTNEELQSMNEEQQSANEELEASKEELQSLNEELQTVNAEFQTKIDDLSHARDDMRNLLNSTDIGTLFLDRDLKIQRYTDQVREVISVIPSDVGRPVGDLVTHVRYTGLADDARRVLDTLVVHEVEVQTNSGKWRLLRMLPYRTSQNVIDGVVVTFIDVDRVKRAELLAASRAFAQSIVQTVREPLVVLDNALQIVSANRAFLRIFQLAPKDIEGRTLFDVGGALFEPPRLRHLLGDLVEHGNAFQDLEIEHDFPGLGRRVVLLNARRLEGENVATGHLLLALTDRGGEAAGFLH